MLPDGGPHSAPVWTGMEGDRIAFLTPPGSRKARDRQHDLRAAISITDRETGDTVAHVRGRGAGLSGPAPPARAPTPARAGGARAASSAAAPPRPPRPARRRR
ncbi:MAG TPA: pyridoxamine 5'-phosphate oxidase family protein [Actinomycetes bacterium]